MKSSEKELNYYYEIDNVTKSADAADDQIKDIINLGKKTQANRARK